MRKNLINCDWCEANLKDSPNIITITTGGEVKNYIDYCNEVCKNEAQKCCGKETNHKNSVKDDSQGLCLDCGESYAESKL